MFKTPRAGSEGFFDQAVFGRCVFRNVSPERPVKHRTGPATLVQTIAEKQKGLSGQWPVVEKLPKVLGVLNCKEVSNAYCNLANSQSPQNLSEGF